jgi:regulator of RNase E activity RraB
MDNVIEATMDKIQKSLAEAFKMGISYGNAGEFEFQKEILFVYADCEIRF